jgi:hypothetical protein
MLHYVHDVNGDYAQQYCENTWLAFEAYLIPLDSVKVTCCLKIKCYRRGSLVRGRLVKELRILLSLFSMAFLSTKGLSCSSCFERLFLTERRTWGDWRVLW